MIPQGEDERAAGLGTGLNHLPVDGIPANQPHPTGLTAQSACLRRARQASTPAEPIASSAMPVGSGTGTAPTLITDVVRIDE